MATWSFMVDYVQLVNSLHQRTPLHRAARRGHVDTVICLVEQGADINIKDENGVCEWEYFADYNSVLLIRICSQSPDQ